MAFDPSKPVQTRDGRPARIVCVDAKHPHGHIPILALLQHDDGTEYSSWHYSHGGIYPSSASNDDLINMMAFDPSKPVQTRGATGIPSRPVRILATDLPGKYPIGGLIEGFANLDRWTTEGRLFAMLGCGYDLINIDGEPEC